jgi:E3 ubiquitin-protein ligase TRIP12
MMANKKQEIDQEQDSELRSRLYLTVKSSKDASIEDYDLSFYNPSDETVELVKDGLNIKVTLDNLQSYIEMVLDSTFNESIRLQIQAFRKGFNMILGVENLRIF